MNLSKQQRAALQQAQHAPLRRVHNPTLPGTPPWPAAANTLHALVLHGLLESGELRNRHGHPVQLWTITDTGREALAPREIVRRDAPTWLAQPGDHGDYTSDPTRRKFPDEVIDPDSLQSAWRQQAEARRTEHQDRKQAAKRTTSILKAA